MDLELSSVPEPADEPFATIRRDLGRAVAAVCPRWLADQQDDITQAAMMRILQLHRQSEGTREFSSSYLWRVAYSSVVDEIRRVRRRREQELDGAEPALDPGGDPPSPEQEVEGRQIGEAISSCLERLARPRRLAVTLYLQGHTVPEAAELLGYGRKKTENLVYRGVADLRRCLVSKGVEP